jgi:hypothetical protein
MKGLITIALLILISSNCKSQDLHFEPIDHFKEHTLRGMFYITGTDKVIYNVLYADNSILYENGISTELDIELYGSVELYGNTYYIGSDGYYSYTNNVFTRETDKDITGHIGSPFEIGNNEIVYTSGNSIIKTNLNFLEFDTLYSTGSQTNWLYSCKKYDDKYIFIPSSYPGRLVFANSDFSEFDSIPINYSHYNYHIIGSDLYMMNGDKGIFKGDLSEDEFSLERVVNVELYGGQLYNGKLIVSSGRYYHSPGTKYYFNPSDNSLQEIPQAEGKNLVLSDGRIILYDLQTGYLASDNNLDSLDILYPDVSAAKFLGWTFSNDTIVAVSERNAYVLCGQDKEWINVNPKEEMYYYGVGSDGIGSVYLYSSNQKYKSLDDKENYGEYNLPNGHFGFGDTTFIIGHQGCSDTSFPTPSLYSSDGINWNSMESPPCHLRKYTTLTRDKFYIYNEDYCVSIGPGNNYYSWFGYFDRNDKEYRMVIPPAELSFPDPHYFGAWTPTQYCFYVSPKDEYHIHPITTDGDSWYYNPSEGYSKTENAPRGRIFPTVDSLGTIIVQNSGPNESPRFFTRTNHYEPYIELNVYPNNLPPIAELSYTSNGDIIIAAFNGRFYITKGITSSNTDISDQRQKELLLYPNPASTVVNILTSENELHKYNLYMSSGEYIKSGNRNKCDVSNLNSGLYIMEIITNKGVRISNKLIISK